MARPANPELRGKILSAASEIIEACGPDCVTMREVAEKVGYSSTTLYLYFKDKRAILKEAVLHAHHDLAETCELAMVGPGALDSLRQWCRAYVIWGLMHPGHYDLMYGPSWEMDWSVELTDDVLERLAAQQRAVGSVLEQAREAGGLAADVDTAALRTCLLAALHGTVSLAITGRLVATASDAAAVDRVGAATRVSDSLVNALLAAQQA